MRLNSDYIYSQTYNALEEIEIPRDALYIYGNSPEVRTNLGGSFLKKIDTAPLEIKEENEDVIKLLPCENVLNLRQLDSLVEFFRENKSNDIYIDVSGLSCRICAPLLHALSKLKTERSLKIKIVYTEPNHYIIENFKKEGHYQNLSERLGGILPLPTLSTIFPVSEKIIFIPFLGFEGGRLAHIFDNALAEEKCKIFPVIGLSGYRPEYPSVAYWGNRYPIIEHDCWASIKYATANSICDSLILLNQIRDKHKDYFFKIAPIGTKPHAIASILHKIQYPNLVEIIFDNPIRSIQRTSGRGKVTITDISHFFNH